jgi:polyisoprenyl-phosphate glycosyltransferase
LTLAYLDIPRPALYTRSEIADRPVMQGKDVSPSSRSDSEHRMNQMRISVCIPVYNGEATIGPLVELVVGVLSSYDLEIVLVNDGSRDGSEAACMALADRFPQVTAISLRRNYGEHNAVMCALAHCTGDYAAIIDDDFQNPPEEIEKLVKEAQQGFDVVYSKYRVKKHGLFRNLGSKFNDVMATALIRKPKDLYLSSFKLISRPIIDEIVKYRGPFPYIDGLILRVTASIGSVYVEHRVRAQGRSNYTLGKLVSLWLNMFINFSIRPMRVISLLGIATSIVSFALGIVFFIDRWLHPGVPAGWASLAILMLALGGIQTFALGMIGEYVGKNYLDRNGTPQWTIKAIKKSGR